MLEKDAKRRIYTDLLKQAPPGEFNAVFDDIRTMNNDIALLDEQCETTLVNYNHENFITATHTDISDVCCFYLCVFFIVSTNFRPFLQSTTW